MTTHQSAAVQSGIMPDHALAGNVHVRYGYITTADDDMVSGDTLELVPIPENARILQIILKSSTDIPGASGIEVGDGASNGRFFNGISLGAASRFFQLGVCGVFSGLGYKYAQDDTIDLFLRKAATKVPTSSTIQLWVIYNITGTISDES